MYYFGARYLDPQISRWMSPDPALVDYLDGERGEGGIYNPINLNVYNYGANNPIKYLDPTGEENKSYIIAIVFRNKNSYDFKRDGEFTSQFRKYSKNNALDTVFLLNTKTKQYTRYDNVQTVANSPKYNKYKKGKDPTVKPGNFKFVMGLTAEQYTPSDTMGITDANSISNGPLDNFYEEKGKFGRVMFHSNTPGATEDDPNPKPWGKKFSGSCFMFDEEDMVNMVDILKRWGGKKDDLGNGFLQDYDPEDGKAPDAFEEMLKNDMKYKKKN